MHRPFAIAVVLLMLACGAPKTITAPTARPTEEIVPTTTPQPTATPAPTKEVLSVVTHAAMGDDWPLIVEEGTIICDGASILLRTNRGLFAVNGTARGQRKWHDIREITKPDPHNAGLLMDVQPIVDRGLIVCR